LKQPFAEAISNSVYGYLLNNATVWAELEMQMFLRIGPALNAGQTFRLLTVNNNVSVFFTIKIKFNIFNLFF
jgi:hypothetical protein